MKNMLPLQGEIYLNKDEKWCKVMAEIKILLRKMFIFSTHFENFSNLKIPVTIYLVFLRALHDFKISYKI